MNLLLYRFNILPLIVDVDEDRLGEDNIVPLAFGIFHEKKRSESLFNHGCSL
jgi:hypothetical protein